jgi:acetylglutamate/LysW-gamma-L-alpha-aminoadipate kinase
MRERIMVLKVGGAAGNDRLPAARELAARVRGGERWILVHGASGAADALCRERGLEPRYVTGPGGFRSRFVGPAERAIFEEAARGESLAWANILESLGAVGVPLLLDTGILTGERKSAITLVESGRRRILRDNWSGRIVSVNLETILASGAVPILPPLAPDRSSGLALDVDGDRLAAAVAAAAGAERLLILSNVPGLLADPEDPEGLIVEGFLEKWEPVEAAARGNMKRKILACREALQGGVAGAILADGRIADPIGAALAGGGTRLWRSRDCTANAA